MVDFTKLPGGKKKRNNDEILTEALDSMVTPLEEQGADDGTFPEDVTPHTISDEEDTAPSADNMTDALNALSEAQGGGEETQEDAPTPTDSQDAMEALLMGLGGSSAGGALPEEEGFDLNFDDMGPKPIAEGIYTARILSAEFGRSKSGGNPQITIEWLIIKGAHAGRTMRSWVTFTENNARRVKQFFTATMGSEATGTKKVKPADLLNRMAEIEIGMGEYRGEAREEVRNVLPYAAGAGKFWQAGAGLDDISPF